MNLKNGEQSMKALFLAMVGKDIYYNFKLKLENHFATTPWPIITSYKKNVVRIWQKIADVDDGYER